MTKVIAYSLALALVAAGVAGQWLGMYEGVRLPREVAPAIGPVSALMVLGLLGIFTLRGASSLAPWARRHHQSALLRGSAAPHLSLHGALGQGGRELQPQSPPAIPSGSDLNAARAGAAGSIGLGGGAARGLPLHLPNPQLSLTSAESVNSTADAERFRGRIDVEALHPSWFIFQRSAGERSYGIIKRGMDLVLCLVTTVAIMPLLIVVAIAIKLESAGPLLYRQERVGLRGRTFTLLKFRSMRLDAEACGTPVWAEKRDHRVTRVGYIIRKLRIDELPQLYNVLRGEMSFVGPRPERPFFVERLAHAIPYYHERHSVKPGITGWAQVNLPYGASVDDARQKLSYDLYYLKHRSVLLDLQILVMTVGVVLRPEGAR